MYEMTDWADEDNVNRVSVDNINSVVTKDGANEVDVEEVMYVKN
jgi:hypothetical protein